MEDNFINTIDYLKKLQAKLISDEEISNEEKLLLIIKQAILNDNFYGGSIILTKEKDTYTISSVQKHSYAWTLKGKEINLKQIIKTLTKLKIAHNLEKYLISDHNNDYELSFSIPELIDYKKKVRTL